MEEQIDKLTSAALDASARGDFTERDRLYRERDALAVKLYGDEPVVGSEGRQL